MNSTINMIQLGIKRGWIEYKIMYLQDIGSLLSVFIIAIGFAVLLWFERKKYVSGISLALLTFPGILGIMTIQEGLTNVAAILSYDKEDGTLLRAKATPQGMAAYCIARVVSSLLTLLTTLTIIFALSLPVVHNLIHISRSGVLIFISLIVLGLFATASIGAIVGATVKSSRETFGLTYLPMIVATALSGIFYPITHLDHWIRVVAQVFPVYWLGLGLRSVFLPKFAAIVEIGHSWRYGETYLILCAWVLAGVVVAPSYLRRMARRISGSDMEASKQRTIRHTY